MKCRRCHAEVLTGQRVCPRCGKPLRAPRQVRCRSCGAVGSRALAVCPGCGGRLRHNWLRPLLIWAALLLAIGLGVLAGPWLHRALPSLNPVPALRTALAVVREIPGRVVVVPTLTSSPEPSITPTPTRTSTPTPTPSLTPTPTPTQTPTHTPSPEPTSTVTPTPTRVRATRSPVPPTRTPTPPPQQPAPVLQVPEDNTPFEGSNTPIKLGWASTYVPGADEFFEVTLRYTHLAEEVHLREYVAGLQWFVPSALYLQADQETDRAYHWSVRLVRRTVDAGGSVVYLALSPASGERTFTWK